MSPTPIKIPHLHAEGPTVAAAQQPDTWITPPPGLEIDDCITSPSSWCMDAPVFVPFDKCSAGLARMSLEKEDMAIQCAEMLLASEFPSCEDRGVFEWDEPQYIAACKDPGMFECGEPQYIKVPHWDDQTKENHLQTNEDQTLPKVGTRIMVVTDRCRMQVKEKRKQTTNNLATNDKRWWAQFDVSLVCPVTKFPISLLPYPPFKLRVNANKQNPYHLVDGKYLAMQLILGSHLVVCGREVEASDIKDLDAYIHRYKLGPFRPSMAIALKKKVETAKTEQAVKELESFMTTVNSAVAHLHEIQQKRLRRLKE